MTIDEKAMAEISPVAPGISRRALLLSAALGIPLLAGAQALEMVNAPPAGAAMSFEQWLGYVNGRLVDRDGGFPANDPYQCWDLWADYAISVHGVPSARTFTNAGGSAPDAGYASNVWHNASAAGLGTWFSKTGPNVTPAPGDVAFWARGSQLFPGSHVAIVVEDRGSTLWTMSQNRGAGHDPAGYLSITKTSLLGYLRAINPIGTTETEIDMTVIANSQTNMWAIVGPRFFKGIPSGHGGAALKLTRQNGPVPVNDAEWNQILALVA